MLEMYLLLKLGAIQGMAVGVTCVCLLVAIATFIMGHTKDDWDSTDEFPKTKGWLLSFAKKNFIGAIIALVFATIIPNKKELLIIYGIGSTIDYIQSNNTAKQLPDKAIKALDKLADEYLKENKN